MTLTKTCISACLLITALNCPSLSLAGGEQLVIKGREIYVDSTPISFAFPFSSALSTAEGKATHLGHYTIVGVLTVDVTTATATGIFRLTTEDGDILFLTLTGYALQPFSLKETVGDFTVTGGTGRFANATGGWHLDSHFVYPVNAGAASNPYVGQLDGVVSIVGHGSHRDGKN